MAGYTAPTEQLVIEVHVRDIERSRAFYKRLGFRVIQDEGTFVRLAWDDHHFMLDEHKDLPPPPSQLRSNLRILVPNVDDYWGLVNDMGARIVLPIGNRHGLRYFIFVDPDGFGLRFATKLPPAET
ncbi:VOC family protein [Chloroflexota bacterium]